MRWSLKSSPPKSFGKQFPEYQPMVQRLLYERGLDNQEKINEFFYPDYDQDLHDPFLMLDMERACDEVLAAIGRRKKICLFGDYDADGVCGAALLQTVIKKLGGRLLAVYIPDRKKEGYGLNLGAVKEVVRKGAELIITVDCGVTDWKEVELANSLGAKVIILDHHRVLKKLPRALAVVDPHRPKDEYPFKNLSAAGVAFKFILALLKKAKSKKIKPGWEKWLLDLVALATVADCMPLLGENRTLVKYGLIVLAQTRRRGLKELMNLARLDPSLKKEVLVDGRTVLSTNLDAYTLGFILGPRLNAASRMDHANSAFRLLTTGSQAEALRLAKQLEDKNRHRQALTDRLFAQAQKKIRSQDWVIFAGDKDWPVGVVGLVAGKITDRYHRPSFIFSRQGGIIKGSARSIPKFNIAKALLACQDFLLEFGGHAGAAGFSLEAKKLPFFEKKMRALAGKSLSKEDLVPEILIDSQVEPEQVCWEVFDLVSLFAPFGQDNPQPCFLMRDLQIEDLKWVGNGQKHLKMKVLASNFKSFNAIGFNFTHWQDKIKRGDKIDLVFEMIADEWNGTRQLQMKIKDLKITNQNTNLLANPHE